LRFSKYTYFTADTPEAVFSAGIFDFKGGSDGSRVGASRFWWVYFVATGCLTLITVTIWLFYIRWRTAKNKREEENLENAA
jgi:hypothetical protein